MSLIRILLIVLTAGLAACGGGGGGGDNNDAPSSDARLTSLVIEGGSLSPAFASSVTDYTANVAFATDSTRVTARTADSGARLTIQNVVTPSGAASDPIPLPIGDTEITVQVTAEDGSTMTYRIVVSRPPPNDDADLADLALTAAPLDQPFDPASTDYDVSAGHLAASTRVIATPSDPNVSAIEVAGVSTPPGSPSAPIPLTVGTTAIDTRVTAEDGVNQKTYRVNVTRADFSTLAPRAYVKATNTNTGDRFGAAVGLSRDLLLVGAPFEQSIATGVDGNQSDNSANATGAVYTYERSGGVWMAGHYLKASNSDNGDRFGWAVAADDDVLVIGAPGEQSLDGTETDNSGNGVGAAYVFSADLAGAPVQTAYLKADNAENLDGFGDAVAVDGNRVLVGARFEASSATGVNGDGTDNAQPLAGAVYLFEGDGGVYTQVAYLKASNTASGTDNQFGNAVAISGDTLAVGAWREDGGAAGINGNQADTSQPNAGAVYVFDRDATGNWAQSAYIKASNTFANQNFGTDLDLDGDLLAVGAPGENTTEPSSGAVYVFSRDAAGNWTQEAFIKAASPGFNDLFGFRVSLEGHLLAVSALDEDSDATGINGPDNQNAPDAGAVYLFERTAPGTWTQIAYVKASNTDAGDLFGSDLVVDGDTLAVGAPGEQGNAAGVNGNPFTNTNNQAGAAYVYR